MQSLTELGRVEIAEVCASVGAIGGFLNYWLKVCEGKTFSWKELAMHLSTSAFTGWMVYEILDYIGLPPGVCAALCGMSGWMGTRLLRIAEIIVKTKAGAEKQNAEH